MMNAHWTIDGRTCPWRRAGLTATAAGTHRERDGGQGGDD